MDNNNNTNTVIKIFQNDYKLALSIEVPSKDETILRIELEDNRTKALWITDILQTAVESLTKHRVTKPSELFKLLTVVAKNGHKEYTQCVTKQNGNLIWTVTHRTEFSDVSFDIVLTEQKVGETARLEKMILDLQEEVKQIKLEKPRIHTMQNSSHVTTTTNANWVLCPGVQKQIELTKESTEVLVFGHCHGNAIASEHRLDVRVFVNNEDCGISGNEICTHGWEKSGPGTALSHTPSWIPVVAIGTITLPKGTHTIDIRIRNAADNGQVSAHGVGMVIVTL